MKPRSKHSPVRSAGMACLALAAIVPWATALAEIGAAPQQRRTTDPPIAATGKLGQDLFMAVVRGNLPGAKELLAKGADPNARNGLEFTPLYLAAAMHQGEMMQALLDGKADPEANSPYGTPLMFAAMTGNARGAEMLMGLGSKVNVVRVDGTTILMMAAQAGNPELVGALLKGGAKVDESNVSNATALSYAARLGHTESCRMLIESGAKIDAVDVDGETPLMAAAKAGHGETVELLLAKGANPNLRDRRGRTALVLAVSYGDNDSAVQALLKHGADRQLADKKNRTAYTLVRNRGFEKSARALGVVEPIRPKVRDANLAVTGGLKLLESSMIKFSEVTGCISCHQEGLGRMVTASAKEKGFKTSTGLNQAQLSRIRGALNFMKPMHAQALTDEETMKQVPLIEIGEVPSGYGWMLAGMAAQRDTPTEATGAATMVLARQQLPNGQWFSGLPRPPMQQSHFTLTAYAVRSLRAFGPRAHAAEVAERIEKAKSWFLATPTASTDDMAFQLLGLLWAGATEQERAASVQALRSAQLADGGWAQLPGMRSDAYATGLALYALQHAGGCDPKDAAIAKGLTYLLRTQDDDGSWFVNKRAMPANNYFDAAFPHGESQYASFNGTAWAVMALLEAMPKAP